MSRSERFNTRSEIKRHFGDSSDQNNGAGVVVYAENGKKYVDDTEAHAAVIGRTGKGKSQCGSLHFGKEVGDKGEILIMLDPKGEGYRKLANSFKRVLCVDFRNPRKSPTKWNPLSTPYRLYKSSDPDNHDIASSMLSELWNGVYPYDGHSDKFWTDSSVNYAKGLTYGLFETAKPSQINLNSVAVMMEKSEIRLGSNTLLKEFYESRDSDSLSKRNLATYTTAPNETRASIHSVATSGLEVFSRSMGLMEMLSEDNLNIMDLDVTTPFALFIITPDETDVYDSLAGLLISQITQHLIRVAQERGGKLPIRVNVILEELGSVGKSIPNLPNLMVAGRSRNIRLMLVLQSISQLTDVYGKSKAETINSCIGITIGFSTNSWETLSEWAQRCGERTTEINGHLVKEPLITASQLAAMPTGTAIVMADSKYKFVSQIPFFSEMYDECEAVPPISHKENKQGVCMDTFDMEGYVRSEKQKKIEGLIGDHTERREGPPSFFTPPSNDSSFVESLISRIDSKIADLEKEEEEERRRMESKPCCVKVLSISSCKEKAIEVISKTLKIPATQVRQLAQEELFDIEVSNGKLAKELVDKLDSMGSVAVIVTDD